MNFMDYLESSVKIANEEVEILNELSQILTQKGELNKIEIRASKASLQTLIENMIGKVKRILKYFNCPIIPTRSKDGLIIMYEVGLIDDETYSSLMSAIGFRNAMIHDYMNFDEKILLKILKDKSYMNIYDFLIQTPNYSEVLLKRIANYNF